MLSNIYRLKREESEVLEALHFLGGIHQSCANITLKLCMDSLGDGFGKYDQ